MAHVNILPVPDAAAWEKEFERGRENILPVPGCSIYVSWDMGRVRNVKNIRPLTVMRPLRT